MTDAQPSSTQSESQEDREKKELRSANFHTIAMNLYPDLISDPDVAVKALIDDIISAGSTCVEKTISDFAYGKNKTQKAKMLNILSSIKKVRDGLLSGYEDFFKVFDANQSLFESLLKKYLERLSGHQQSIYKENDYNNQ